MNILKKFNKIYNCENIIISSNYKESFYSYKLCAHADLVISKHTSLADECLVCKIPVLFYEYAHNMKKTLINPPNYLPTELICNNFGVLLEKSKFGLLFEDIVETASIDPGDVKWRGQNSKRKWLAGTVNKMNLSILDVNGLISSLK